MDPNNVNILVVDDDRRTCEYMAKFLSDRGWAADTASDGPAAIELAETKRYDAVVLDYRLPGMDGARLAAASGSFSPESEVCSSLVSRPSTPSSLPWTPGPSKCWPSPSTPTL